jgi:uncharacterized linocin/CFP29 family protein
MKTERAEALWPEEVWNGIEEAVADESRRIKVAAQILPSFRPMVEARTVPSERLQRGEAGLFIDEAPVTPLQEIWVEFALTRQQVEREAELATARTLARRAANTLAQAEDAIIFQGVQALEAAALFREERALQRSGPTVAGLVDGREPGGRVIEIPALDPAAVADLPALDPAMPRFGERTFEAVSKAYLRLQEREHHGPYALVLPPGPFADTQAALPQSLLRPAERIRNLLRGEIHATSQLPPHSGVLVSLGGSALDLVMGREPEATFMFEDAEGKYRFRVWERFALRVRDETAIVRLDFKAG